MMQNKEPTPVENTQQNDAADFVASIRSAAEEMYATTDEAGNVTYVRDPDVATAEILDGTKAALQRQQEGEALQKKVVRKAHEEASRSNELSTVEKQFDTAA